MYRLAATIATIALAAGCVARVNAHGRARAGGTAGGQATPVPPPPANPTTPPPTPTPPPPSHYDTPSGPILIAGAPVVRVGINFEDMRGGDGDHNDAVMCFEGRFRVDGSNVVSTEVQDVLALTSSISDCRHNVRVEIIHPDGSRARPITFESRSGKQVPMRFAVGSRLEVYVQTYAGGCHTDEMSMHTSDAQVLLDRCNTTGR